MAEAPEQTISERGRGEGSGGTAVKAAAAAAATGVAALAAKKALSARGHSGGEGNGGSAKDNSDSVFSSMLSGGWEAARDSLLPAAEDAAGAAGKFLAENGPEVIRERILPRFIDSFNKASEGS
jgi:hypothetical protein